MNDLFAGLLIGLGAIMMLMGATGSYSLLGSLGIHLPGIDYLQPEGINASKGGATA